MFYVKEKISDAVNVTVEITDENVFTRCPGCGNEVCIDLAELFSDGECDLYGTSVYCEECSLKIRSSKKSERSQESSFESLYERRGNQHE